MNFNYEKINERYVYSNYGDFKLILDTETNFFNASAICKEMNKSFSDWFKSNRTKKNLKTLEDMRSAPQFYVNKSSKGIKAELVGTFITLTMILDLASWISMEFYIKAASIVDSHLIKEKKEGGPINPNEDQYERLIRFMELERIRNSKKDEDINSLANILIEKDKKIDKLIEIIESDRKKNIEREEKITKILETVESIKTESSVILNCNGDCDSRDSFSSDSLLSSSSSSSTNRSTPSSEREYILYQELEGFPKKKINQNMVCCSLLRSKNFRNEFVLVKGPAKLTLEEEEICKVNYDFILKSFVTDDPTKVVNKLLDKIKIYNESFIASKIYECKMSDEFIKSTNSERMIMLNKIKNGVEKLSVKSYPKNIFIELARLKIRL